MSHQSNFDNFLQELVTAVGEEIHSIVVFGSQKGLDDPTMSDMDILIVDKDMSKGKELFKVIRDLEKKHLGTSHSRLVDFISRNLLIGVDYHGVEIILIGKNEFDENFNSKSFRLKFLSTFFISKNLFLSKIKEDGKVVHGEDYLKRFEPRNLNFFDRLKTFTFAGFILFTVPFFHLFNRKEFIIWCVKGLKYHIDIAAYYNKLVQKPNQVSNPTILDIYKLRYAPETCKGNKFVLYFRVWGYVLGNASFLFGRSKYFI